LYSSVLIFSFYIETEQCSLPETPQETRKEEEGSGQMVKNSSCKKLLQFRLQEWNGTSEWLINRNRAVSQPKEASK